MGIISTSQGIPYQATGFLGFVGLVLVANYDRLGIWVLYRFLKIRVHNSIFQLLLNMCVAAIGFCVVILAYLPSLAEENLIQKISGFIIIPIVYLILRHLTVKSDYLYFSLDDDFYLDKNGNDIRKKEN
jgi:hypothetical protein